MEVGSSQYTPAPPPPPQAPHNFSRISYYAVYYFTHPLLRGGIKSLEGGFAIYR